MSDEQKERIKLEIEVLRYLVVFGLTMGGGSLSVFMGKAEGIRLIMATIGILATMSVGILSWLQYLKIGVMIREGGSYESQ